MTGALPDIEELAATVRAVAAGRGRAVLLGIDGPGASGKSTLAALLADRLGPAAVVHIDDFHLPSAERRRVDRVAVAAHFDLRRLHEQVLRPAAEGAAVRYQHYDWDQDRLAGWTSLPPGTPLVVEGVHALHADLRHLYTYRVFCDAPRELRLSRGLERDGEEARSLWVDEWMPAEDRYLAAHTPHRHADIVLGTTSAPAP
ncbi:MULTISPECIES: uridine kinase [unclassified Streptomyces]|uniref:uridine kinase family protein n=1 Tax=unclassified Streptomyces TaxID=2593676 RepID=UPI0029AE7F29|nr:uridine kinase [Streptomyces sp. DK15]MDX2389013.1 uridine kinase [Streptomyces sp. DK15]